MHQNDLIFVRRVVARLFVQRELGNLNFVSIHVINTYNIRNNL